MKNYLSFIKMHMESCEDALEFSKIFPKDDAECQEFIQRTTEALANDKLAIELLNNNPLTIQQEWIIKASIDRSNWNNDYGPYPFSCSPFL